MPRLLLFVSAVRLEGPGLYPQWHSLEALLGGQPLNRSQPGETAARQCWCCLQIYPAKRVDRQW